MDIDDNQKSNTIRNLRILSWGLIVSITTI